jgi:hypothetical protein
MTILSKPTKPNPGFRPPLQVKAGSEEAQNPELGRYVRAALTGLLAYNGIHPGFISKQDEELNTLTHQAHMIGVTMYEKELSFKQKRDAVRRLEQKLEGQA